MYTDTRRDARGGNHPGADRYLGAGGGRKMGERTGTGATVDVGTRRRDQGRAEGVGGLQLGATPR